jgi:hypothetical protein
MADWTNLPNTAVGVGGLPSGTTVTALRDNPVAIAEGAAGAPKIKSKALEGFMLSTFSAAGSNWAGFVDLDDFSELFFYAHGGGSTGGIGGAAIQIRFSVNNGSSWSSEATLLTLGPNSSYNSFFFLRLNIVTGVYRVVFDSSFPPASGTFSLPSGSVNGVQLRGASNGLGMRGSAMVTGGRV